MANFIVNTFNQIYASAGIPVAPATKAPEAPAAQPAAPEASPALSQPVDHNTVTGSCNEAAFQPQAANFPTPSARPALSGVPVMVRALKAKAESAPPTVEAINERYAKKLETLKANQDLEPTFRQAVVRQIHDEHIGELALATAEQGHQSLGEELSSYQRSVQSVRSGSVLADNPGLVRPEHRAVTQANLEEILYQDLVGDMSGIE